MRTRKPKSHVEKELRAKHPLAIRWFHWMNFPVLALMIWSGLMILWSNDVFTLFGHKVLTSDSLEHPLALYDRALKRNPEADGAYTLGSRLAEGMWWHFALAWLFAINGLLYVLYLLRSREWRTIAPSRGAVKEAIHVVLVDLHLSRKPLPDRKYNAAQQIAYTGVIVLGLGALLTGLAIYKPMRLSPLTGLLGGYTAARFEHFWIMVAFCAFFLVHVFQVAKTGWNNFRGMVTGYEMTPVETPIPEGEAAA